MERRAISWVLILAVLVSFLNQRTVVSFAEGVEQKNQIKTDKVEMADTVTTLSIYYDDHIDIRGKKVDILDAGNPSSFQVGYGVEEQTPDPAVLCLEDDTLVAVGVGTAKVKIDGEIYEVEVTAAPISLLLLSGQSNMQGVNGNPSQSVICPIGQVYASFADGRILNRYTAEYLAPSALVLCQDLAQNKMRKTHRDEATA